MPDAISSKTPLEDWAFQYPGPVWRDPDAIKNMVLFFDGLAILVPTYLPGRAFQVDPSTAAGLFEHGLLRELQPESFIDKAAAEELTTQLVDLIVGGAFDPLVSDDSPFEELSMSRLGWSAAPELAQMIFDELRRRKLARDSEDGVSIPMHRSVRGIVLVLLAQILAPRGTATYGIGLSPCTDQPGLVRGLVDLLRVQGAESVSHVLQEEIAYVGVDLTAVPIDEVLGFRRENYSAYRLYITRLRSLMRELTSLPEAEQTQVMADRRREIDEHGKDLLDRAKRAWKLPAAFGLGLSGCLWAVGTGDPVGGLILAGLGLATLPESSQSEIGFYSYLYSAQRRFPARSPRA